MGATACTRGPTVSAATSCFSALPRRFPAVGVVPDVLYVVDDRVATSAGVASGIDLALHVIVVDHAPVLAARMARSMVVQRAAQRCVPAGERDAAPPRPPFRTSPIACRTSWAVAPLHLKDDT